MSDEKPKETVDDFKQKVNAAADLETLKQETQAKKAVIDHRRASAQLDEIKRNDKDLEIIKKANFGVLSQDGIEKLQKANHDYMEAAKSSMFFIAKTFDDLVPFFRKNFILIGGKTGDGKSTTVANIVYSTLKQLNPATGKYRRALVITNEERGEDFYNRVTCLVNGWHYVNHNKFTEEQKKTFNDFIPKLAPMLTVIDDGHEGSQGTTTTIEGIESIFNSLIERKEYYDVIIIDYYQNIISSKVSPYMSENEVQARLARAMDRYKNEYPAPIVMMAQVNPQNDKDKAPFQHRIKGRKIIMDPATFVVEMMADRENLKTVWRVWKSRFTEVVGKDIVTGYEKGKYVDYTLDFIENVQKLKYMREAKAIDRASGIKDVDFTGTKKDEKKDENPTKV